MARNFNELRAKMSPERRERNDREVNAILEKMALHELRRARRKTQSGVAEAMGMGQGAISKIEQRGATSIGTLDSYVRSLGGRLVLRAEFPDKVVELSVAGE